MTIEVEFIDAGRKATEKPNPKYPDGITIDLAQSRLIKSCTRNLPYPAPQCGMYRVTCLTCKLSIVLTVAGRADDPRIITMPCKK